MGTKKTLTGFEDILAEAQQSLRNLKKKICRKCKQVKQLVQSGFCAECYLETQQETEERKKESRLVDPDKGYIRIYHPVTGKLVLEHRYIMEQILGRPLRAGEVVLHRDLDNSNNDPSNLMLGFKAGTPLEALLCKCGLRGHVTYSPESEESAPTTLLLPQLHP